MREFKAMVLEMTDGGEPVLFKAIEHVLNESRKYSLSYKGEAITKLREAFECLTENTLKQSSSK